MNDNNNARKGANKWYGTFTFEQVEKIREKAKNDLSLQADIAGATGNSMELTQLILSGPHENMIAALKEETDEAAPLAKAFNKVWGQGASEHYSTLEEPHGLFEHLSELPGAATRGLFGAVSEINESMFNARRLDPAYIRQLDESGIEVPEWARDSSESRVEWDADTILRGVIEKPETLTGQITEGAVQFAAPFFTGTGAASKLKVLEQAGTKGKLAMATVIGMATDYVSFDEDDPLMTTALADYFGVENSFIDEYLRHDIDDTEAEKRFKRSLEGGVVGVGVDAIMMGVARVVRGVRTGKVNPDDAATEIQKIINDVDAEELASTIRQEPKPDPRMSFSEQQRLWHFDAERAARTVAADTQPANAATKVAEDIAKEAEVAVIESIPPRFEQAAESLTGTPSKPQVSAKEHQLAIDRATKIWNAARSVTDNQTAWDIAKGYLKDATDTLAEHGVRTRDQLKGAIMKPFQQALKMVDSGDIQGLRKWADADSLTIADFRLRSYAIQMASRSLRAQTERMAGLVEAAMNSGRLSAHEDAVMREMFHKQVQLSMEVEALNTNLGSAAGALLGQRAGQMNIYDEITSAAKKAAEEAEAKGLSKRQTKKAVRDATRVVEKKITKRLRETEGGGNGSFLSQRYRELVKEGVDPVLAFQRVRAMGDEAHRSGTILKQKNKQQLEDAKAQIEQEGKLNKALRGLEQWRYNAMLSGIKTHETNFLSSFAQMTSRIAYEAAWGALSRDKQMTKMAAQKVIGMTTGMKDSLHYAIEAYKQMKPILDDITQFERLDPVYKNHILTYPSRLMIGTDQFIKQLAYRGEVRASAVLDADLAGLKGAKKEDFIKDRMDKAFDPETGAGLDMLAITRAQEVTFQKQFDPKSSYHGERLMGRASEITNGTMAGRFLFPFMRIFFRLTDEGIRMTPGVRESIAIASKLVNVSQGKHGSSKFWDDLMGHNGKASQARAAGEYAVGLSIVGWTMALVAEGKITGGEERNYVDASMRRKVIPPYSIYVNGEWHSYERFEPFAFPMKFFANTMIRMRKVSERQERGEFEREGEMLQAQIGAMAYVFSEAVTNNSFMEGLESLVKATGGSFESGEAWKRPVHTMAESYFPNILRKANQSLDDSGHKYKAEPLTLNAFARHFSSVINMDDVDLERNQFTGEPYVYTDQDDLAGNHLFVGKPESTDKAMKLLIEANEHTGKQYVLRRPGSFIRNEDLRDYKADDGKRSLYDQYQDVFSTTKINGKTYREALEALADDPLFMRFLGVTEREPQVPRRRPSQTSSGTTSKPQRLGWISIQRALRYSRGVRRSLRGLRETVRFPLQS